MGSEREQIVKRLQIPWNQYGRVPTQNDIIQTALVKDRLAAIRGDHLPTERTDNGGQHE